jgi:hypothetical protein
MPGEPVHEPQGEVGGRVEEGDPIGEDLPKERHQQGVVRAAEQEGVDVAQLRDIAADGLPRHGRGLPTLLHDGDEQGRGALGHAEVAELADLGDVGPRLHGAAGGEDPDVAAARRHGQLGARDGDPQHAKARLRSAVATLEVAQGHAGDRVAGHHHEAAALLEETLAGLLGEIQDRVRVAPPVGRPARVPQEEEVPLREHTA